MTPVESLVAVALTLRGAEVDFLLCDEFLPACMHASYRRLGENQEAFVAQGPAGSLCRACWPQGKATYEPLGLRVLRYSEWVTSVELEQASHLAQTIDAAAIPGYRLDGLAIGEHALAGALRYFAKGTLDDEPYGEPILRRYFRASLLSAFAIRRLLATRGYECAVFNHGIYVPQGLIGEVARQSGVRVVNWIVAYRKRSFIFSHDDTYHHTLMTEPVSAWETIPWSEALDEEVMSYLTSRWHGSRDWIYFHKTPQEDLDQIAAATGIDFSKPLVTLLTNVMWDAQLHYPANAFPNMLDWVLQTISYFSRRPDLQLAIRVHPAELSGTIPSRQPILAEIHRAFPTLPPNIFLIGPESSISTYVLSLAADTVIIYGTKTGVEVTSFGVPTLVAGEAWIRGKGVTIDALSAEDYFRQLDRLPLGYRMDEATQQRARKYAFHFFFRRMIPLGMVEQQEGWPRFRIALSGLDDLLPGCDPGLDVICDGILTGAPFVYPAETLIATAPIPVHA